MKYITKRLQITAFVLACLSSSTHGQQAKEAVGQPARPVAPWFAHAGLGLFLHFDMSTFADSEWASGYEDPELFAPAKLDCGQWADVAVAAGMKYAILTVKHTGGWCLWPSAYTKHGVQSFRHFREGKGDLVREFVEAFRARGIKVGLYYCFPGDYSGKYGNVLPAGKSDLHGLPPEAEGDYAGFIKKQLAELVTNYRPDLIWIDQFSNKYTLKNWLEIKNHVHQLAPDCILIGNNSHDLKTSDAMSYEWPLNPIGKASSAHGLPGHVGSLPPAGNTDPAEVCDTIQTRSRWFWHPNLGADDLQTADLIAATIRLCHERNANYLLNVPPDRDGLISGIHLQRMQEVSRRLAAAGSR
jgi:alpha-L-fucosidase